MLPQSCPWTAAAVAAEEHSRRARDAAHYMRKTAAPVDDCFEHTVSAAMKIADKEDRMADSLVWVRDQAIFFAQHGEAVARFRELLEAGHSADYAGRAAIRDTRTTMPVGGAAITVLDQVRAGR